MMRVAYKYRLDLLFYIQLLLSSVNTLYSRICFFRTWSTHYGKEEIRSQIRYQSWDDSTHLSCVILLENKHTGLCAVAPGLPNTTFIASHGYFAPLVRTAGVFSSARRSARVREFSSSRTIHNGVILNTPNRPVMDERVSAERKCTRRRNALRCGSDRGLRQLTIQIFFYAAKSDATNPHQDNQFR